MLLCDAVTENVIPYFTILINEINKLDATEQTIQYIWITQTQYNFFRID